MKPKRIIFQNCPICDAPYHSLRVIRLLSNEKTGKYVVWCGNKHKFKTLYKEQ